MKKALTLLTLMFTLLFVGCSSQSGQWAFGTSDCDEYFNRCLNTCIKKGDKPRNQCLVECDKSRGMCKALQIKGCMQKCQEKYGKGTPQERQCRASCSK